ncbi:lanthionine synthetase C family protein [Actinospica robiniae]|uniref:lanthionine synthetase C family protein n=1 Tax=Actinospica robiniae TaxID=304901 RepID=UPI00041EE2EA|nr:lanthionine synthetase C family protein [Actinospica robiniae]
MPAGTAALAHRAEEIARSLSTPTPPPPGEPWLASSLTKGPVGISLLHSERARAGLDSWDSAHTWLKAAAANPVSAAETTGLYLGICALTFALDTASERYAAALTDLDRHVQDLAHRRVAAATQRLEAGKPAAFREYDIFFGLTGIGALLARRDPAGNTLERVLTHLVALTRPLHVSGVAVPGWWVGHDPHRRQSPDFATGHANLGAAHGITGVLLLLAGTARRGISVPGQLQAISRICAFLDRWEQPSERGPWWPQWLTYEELTTGRTTQAGPGRPSWCYGTPGIARAQQIAAIALDDSARQEQAQQMLALVLEDAATHRRLTDPGLCHGWAGIYMTGLRAALDVADPKLDAAVDAVAHELGEVAHERSPGRDPGLLEGDAGFALALTAAAHRAAPSTGWDTCLLIN